MKKLSKKQGFSVIGILVVVVSVALIGFVGYLFYNNYIVKDQNPVASGVPTAPEIVNAVDLDSAKTILDNINLDTDIDTDLTQLESELNNF